MSERISLPTTDTDGSPLGSLYVNESLWVAGGTFVELTQRGEHAAGHLTAEEAARLGAWLVKRYGLDGWTAEAGEVVGFKAGAPVDGATRGTVEDGPDSDGDYRIKFADGSRASATEYVYRGCVLPLAVVEAMPAAPVEIGGEYRLLPGSTFVTRGQSMTNYVGGIDRVRVERGPDEDGDYRVCALTGPYRRRVYVVSPQFLAPVEAPAEETPLKAGDRATVTEDFKANYRQWREGDRVEVTQVGGGMVRVRRLSDDVTTVTFARRLRREVAEVAPEPAPPALKVGDVVALKPNATSVAGRGRAFTDRGTTRVRIDENMGDGDYLVTGLNGRGVAVGLRQWVGRAYLGDPEPTAGDVAEFVEDYGTAFHTGDRVRVGAETARGVVEVVRLSDGETGVCFPRRLRRVGAEPQPWVVGDEAIVTRDYPRAATLYAGDRVRVIGVNGDTIRAEFMRGRGSQSGIDGGWYLSTEVLRRP